MTDPSNPPAGVPPLHQNRVSLVGLVLVVGGVTGFVLGIFLDVVPGESHAYHAIFLLPSASATGLGALVFALGLLRETRRRRRGRAPSFSRILRLDSPRLRQNLVGSVVAGTVVVTITLFGVGTCSTELYELTESNAFCGGACHSVMHPQWVAFQNSPHARLHCVDCHIGPRVESYVSVKLSGLRQLVAVVTGSYERPIHSPTRELRPARRICEQCHWAGSFSGYHDHTRSYFLGDAQNTPFKLRMLTKVGGGTRGFLEGSGIHYHMVVAAKVEYVARGPDRQEIPWVRVTRANGEVTEYSDVDGPLGDEERATLEIRTMDCLDCHNRPAHRFESPVNAVDAALAAGRISRGLPYVKVQSVKALDAPYETQAEGVAAIADQLRAFYRENYGGLVDVNDPALVESIEALQEIYRTNFFPEMDVGWSTHPDNIGHRDWPGCFRCHNDRMRSQSGETIVTRCNSCHVIVAQGEDVQRVQTNFDRGERFYHPGDEDYLEEWTECVDCHSGGADFY